MDGWLNFALRVGLAAILIFLLIWLLTTVLGLSTALVIASLALGILFVGFKRLTNGDGDES